MENRTETAPTIEELQQQTKKQAEQIAALSAKLKWYEDQFHLAQQKRFGASSERTHPDQIALDLFNEAEAEANPALPELGGRGDHVQTQEEGWRPYSEA